MVALGIGIGVPFQLPRGIGGVGPVIPPLILEAFQPLGIVTNNRSGARFSRNPLTPDLLIGENFPDTWQNSGVWQASSEAGVSNLVPSDLALWTLTDDGVTPAVVRADQGSGVWRLTFQIVGGSTVGSSVDFSFGGSPIGGARGFSGFMYRVISGITADLTMKYAAGTPASDAITSFNDDGLWHDAMGYPDAARTANQLQLRGTTDGGSGTTQTLVIEVKRMRCADVLKACPAFPDYGAAGASFGSDRLSVPDPLLPTTSQIITGITPYDWGVGAPSGATRPNSGARMWNFTSGAAINLRLSGSSANQYFLDGNANVNHNGIMTDGQNTSMISRWDGVDTYGEGVPGTNATATDVAVPSGTWNLGNNNGGTRDSGSTQSFLAYSRHLSAGENTTVTDYLAGI